MGIYPLQGTMQHYIWGGENYIPQWLGLEKQQQHYAEWWLGAHVLSPSMIQISQTTESLNQFIDKNPKVLGKKTQQQFGKQLPYLLKILDVAKPLSIQLHPTKQQAEIGFKAETAKGVALTDATRTYKDDNHKPEMMVALSDFWLLHGFKVKQAILDTLTARPSLKELATLLVEQGIEKLYQVIMQADSSQLAQWLMPIIAKNQEAYRHQVIPWENPDYWVLYTIEAMGISPEKLDAGLLCFYLFNLLHLKKGEGIFQDAGIPHAYLRGQNIELMACSDNVIRGGLTPKHVDIDELLKIIDIREVVPQIIPVAPQEEMCFTYSTPAKDFALERMSYHAQSHFNAYANGAEIICVMEGEVQLTSQECKIVLQQGQAAFICANTVYQVTGLKPGYAILAKVPD